MNCFESKCFILYWYLAYFLAKQHAEHVATIANIPITPDNITSHVPADAITLAAVKVFFTAHESIAVTEYFSNKSTRDCFISSEFIIVCISFGERTDPWRDNWKHELKNKSKLFLKKIFFQNTAFTKDDFYLVDEKSNV